MKQVHITLMVLTGFKARLSILFTFAIHVLGNVILARDAMPFAGLPEGKFHESLKRGQPQDCQPECSSLVGVLSCTTSACFCPFLNQAGPSAAQTCATCLETISNLTMYAKFLPLIGQVCGMCEPQCAALLTAIITEGPACLDTPLPCACSIIKSVSLADIASCTCCIQTFDPTDVSGALSLENQCGLNLPLPTCPAASAASTTSTSAPAPPPLYTSSGTLVYQNQSTTSTTAAITPVVVLGPSTTNSLPPTTTTSTPGLSTVSHSDAWKFRPYPFEGVSNVILCVEILAWFLLGQLM